jgi:homoserine O-acetyltransferase
MSIGELVLKRPFMFACGAVLPELRVRYSTYGKPGREAVFIFPPLAQGAHLAGGYDEAELALLTPFERRAKPVGWLDHVVGPGKVIATDRFFVVAAATLGGTLGTTGPTSIDPATGRPYGHDFPEITMGDIVHAHALVLDHLEVDRVWAIGNSLGGLQALEFAIAFPQRVAGLLAMTSSHRPNFFIGQLESLTSSLIRNDPAFIQGYGAEQPPGLRSAIYLFHMMAYTRKQMDYVFANTKFKSLDDLTTRHVPILDAVSHLRLLAACAHYDGRGERTERLAALDICKRLGAVEDDQLFPPAEVEATGKDLDAECLVVQNGFGHLAFGFDLELQARTYSAFLREAVS